MTSWTACWLGKRMSALMIDGLTVGVADGSVGTEQIKIWLMDDTFFFSPVFRSFLRMCRRRIKGESIIKNRFEQIQMRTAWRIIIPYPLRLRGALSVQELRDDRTYSYDKQRHPVSRRTWAVIISNALSPVKSCVCQSWFCGEMPLLIPLHLNLLACWWADQIET